MKMDSYTQKSVMSVHTMYVHILFVSNVYLSVFITCMVVDYIYIVRFQIL